VNTTSDDPPEADEAGFRPHDVIWSEEQVTRFWDYVSQTSTGEYFSSKYASELASEIKRRISRVGVILDVGCGGGHLLRELHSRGHRVLGIDSSPASIAWARQTLPDVDPSSFSVGAMTALPLADASVDTVLLIEVVEHVLEADLRAVFTEAYRVLRPGGHIFITTRNDEDLAANSVRCPECGATFHRMQHMRRWTARLLSRALEAAGFVDVHASGRRFVEPGNRLEQMARRVYYRLRGDKPDLVAVGTHK
jgi:2-polyprenyl-3-methyl-5-hydroxy-6-metoxy-1,4-benzoquinol methylase